MAHEPDFSDGATQFGARMGRGTIDGDTMTSHQPLRFYLRRIPINRGGYDAGGAYWGLGQPLYWASVEAPGIVETWFRARDRNDAKARLRARFPNARFFGA